MQRRVARQAGNAAERTPPVRRSGMQIRESGPDRPRVILKTQFDKFTSGPHSEKVGAVRESLLLQLCRLCKTRGYALHYSIVQQLLSVCNAYKPLSMLA